MVRVRKAGWKAVFLVGAFGGAFVVDAMVLPALPDVADTVLAGVVSVLPYVLASRFFRGVGERVGPPRAWWRMTARPRAGFMVGALLVANVGADVFYALGGDAGEAARFGYFAVIDGVLAALYISSSVRLVRHPPVADRAQLDADALRGRRVRLGD